MSNESLFGWTVVVMIGWVVLLTLGLLVRDIVRKK